MRVCIFCWIEVTQQRPRLVLCTVSGVFTGMFLVLGAHLQLTLVRTRHGYAAVGQL
jgi:hypothetical protein